MTRAVLLTEAGNVHRVIVGGDGADKTVCAQRCCVCAPVNAKQARVFNLAPCPVCWPDGRWSRFLEVA